MISAYFNIAVCCEICAMIVAIICLLKGQSDLWRLFVPFLAVSLIVEAAGTYFEVSKMYGANHILYNIFMLIQAGFFITLFCKFTPRKNIKQIISIVVLVFLASYITETIAFPFTKYRMYSRMTLSVVIAFCSCVFYASLFKQDDIKTPVSYSPFWIVTGLFIYYFVSLPLFAFYMIVSEIRLVNEFTVYDLVISMLNIFLYGCWITAFIWNRKR